METEKAFGGVHADSKYCHLMEAAEPPRHHCCEHYLLVTPAEPLGLVLGVDDPHFID